MHVDDSEVLPENFDSIRALTNYAERKTGNNGRCLVDAGARDPRIIANRSVRDLVPDP